MRFRHCRLCVGVIVWTVNIISRLHISSAFDQAWREITYSAPSLRIMVHGEIVLLLLFSRVREQEWMVCCDRTNRQCRSVGLYGMLYLNAEESSSSNEAVATRCLPAATTCASASEQAPP